VPDAALTKARAVGSYALLAAFRFFGWLFFGAPRLFDEGVAMTSSVGPTWTACLGPGPVCRIPVSP
jgi:hypothetical protein